MGFDVIESNESCRRDGSVCEVFKHYLTFRHKFELLEMKNTNKFELLEVKNIYTVPLSRRKCITVATESVRSGRFLL